MKAAVVNDFKEAPKVSVIETPKPAANEQTVHVLAAAVYPRVRSQANGTHYTSTGELPFVPGLDGVGQTEAGQTGYFITSNAKYGALAEQAVIDHHRFIPLDNGIDAARVAAGMNPAMSAWMSIKVRVGELTGKKVMVLGATGAAGQMAVQISHYLGASEVIGVGRNQTKLAALSELGATQTISLRDDQESLRVAFTAAADVDVVLDYLWGTAASTAMKVMLPARQNHSQQLLWIEIGSMSGADMVLPSAALRSVNLNLVGSGQGSINARQYLAELPELAQLISVGQFKIASTTMPLTELNETNWNDVTKRVVYTMN
ncbi:quinone oxidoreductase family protein [Furfurilactobacillus rossiae]|uniref:Alcohol dehydrogenase zinc-binding domain-containing protein n=1 Tax=Furfurilactobacillus rossiae DSM 15814 TaxID=1114972 RepID=A0A0R1RFQ9_9LACO|nr:zinc-binding alcohol dehydrogenase family protein [Furfurilactobacillus rossiae]KRL55805.1 alcohol dehydrogenase zinc-binding domain-containing protein [Furfurilactobacillus rossiae DSM 15814]QFR67247.1 zinc-binding dehydrogenase [Furfurilactobacillus rossiae]QLE60172.1 Quinone oxidoreductase [Furfurilactobacillus rossiae]